MSEQSEKVVTIEPATLEQVMAYVDTLEPGRLPYPLFLKMAKLLTQATVELIPVRTNEHNETEVLLTQRPAGDLWEGEWHVPGTILLADDKIEYPDDYRDAMKRLVGASGELKSGVVLTTRPKLITAERRVTRRGPEFSAIHVAQVSGEPTVGKFVRVADIQRTLPDGDTVIEHHADFIPRTVALHDAQFFIPPTTEAERNNILAAE